MRTGKEADTPGEKRSVSEDSEFQIVSKAELDFKREAKVCMPRWLLDVLTTICVCLTMLVWVQDEIASALNESMLVHEDSEIATVKLSFCDDDTLEKASLHVRLKSLSHWLFSQVVSPILKDRLLGEFVCLIRFIVDIFMVVRRRTFKLEIEDNCTQSYDSNWVVVP